MPGGVSPSHGLAVSYGTFLPPSGLVLVLALMLVAGVGVYVLFRLGFRAIGGLAKRTPGESDDRLVLTLARPVALLFAVLAAGTVLGLVGTRADPATVPPVRTLLTVAFVLAAAWVVVRGARQGLEAAGRHQARLLPATRVGGRLVAVVVFTVAFLMVLQQYGISIAPLIAGLGIAGLAAALALQDVLGNFFAGLSIQTGQALQPGHYVRLEDQKLEGYVETVGWRTTHIRSLAGNTIVIPNSKLAQAVVTDYYLPTKDLSVGVDVRVGMEADPKKVVDAMREEAEAVMAESPELFLAGNKPFASLARVADDALVFNVSFRVPEFVQQYAAQRAVVLRIFERFRKDGIRIPFPTRHNYQEAVKPEARRVPGAPGGLAPRSRPKPKHRSTEQPQDPRVAEAEKAREQIAAKQVQEQEKAKEP